MTLNDIMQSAQGGQAIDNLAGRFGLSPEQAQSAVNALLPAFQMGLQNAAQSGGGLQTILQHLGSGTHQDAFQNADAAQSPAAAQQGGSILGELFGGHTANTQIAQQAATQSGVPASVIQAMLPIIASMVMGGLFHGAQSSGFGGILSSMIGAAMGGGGSMFGGGAPAQPTGTAPQEGGLGGVLVSVLGGLFGGGASEPETNPDLAPASPAQQAAPGVPAAEGDAVLDELSRMFQAGTPTSPEHQANLAGIIQSQRG